MLVSCRWFVRQLPVARNFRLIERRLSLLKPA
jgi:hypothetical protein